MKLSIYLYKSQFVDFEGLLESDWLEPAPGSPPSPQQQKRGYYKPISASIDFDFECKAFIHVNASTPQWFSFINEGFHLDTIESSNCSAVILVKIDNRILAITFGYAYAALDYTKIEPYFGLITVLNMNMSDRVRRIQGRTLQSAPSFTLLQSTYPLAVVDQNIDVYRNLITEVSCPMQSEQYGKEALGSDALKISIKKITIQELGLHCQYFLSEFSKNDYKHHHDYIDFIRVVKNDPDLVDNLDNLMCIAFENDDELLNLVPPNLLMESPDHYRLSLSDSNQSDTKEKTDDLNYSPIKEYVNKIREFYIEREKPNDLPTVLKKVMICPYNNDDKPMTNRRKLYDYIAYECSYLGSRYVFASGLWYCIDQNYYQSVEAQVSQITDITTQLSLPSALINECEGDYNNRVSEVRDYLHMDKQNYQIPGYTYQKIEVCDLLTRDKKFICIKKMNSSADLSHLFAQMSVSADLLAGEPNYRQKIIDKAREQKNWAFSFDSGANNVEFVLGIISKKPGPLHETLYTMAKINLIHQAKRVRNLGARVSLCKIDASQP